MEKKCRIASGLQFIKFDFVTGSVEITLSIVWWNFDSFSSYFVSLVNNSLLSSLFVIFFFLF